MYREWRKAEHTWQDNPVGVLEAMGHYGYGATGPAWSLLFLPNVMQIWQGSVHPKTSFLQQVALSETLGQERGRANIYF